MDFDTILSQIAGEDDATQTTADGALYDMAMNLPSLSPLLLSHTAANPINHTVVPSTQSTDGVDRAAPQQSLHDIATRMYDAFATKRLNSITHHDLGIPSLTDWQKEIHRRLLTAQDAAKLPHNLLTIASYSNSRALSRRAARTLTEDDILIARLTISTLITLFPLLAMIPNWQYNMKLWKRNTLDILSHRAKSCTVRELYPKN
jgi:hypothetical protein